MKIVCRNISYYHDSTGMLSSCITLHIAMEIIICCDPQEKQVGSCDNNPLL